MTENKNVIQDQVYKNRNDTGNHRNQCLAGFPKRTGVGVGQSEGEQAEEHDKHIVKTVLQCGRGIGRIALSLQV